MTAKFDYPNEFRVPRALRIIELDLCFEHENVMLAAAAVSLKKILDSSSKLQSVSDGRILIITDDALISIKRNVFT